MKIVVSILRLLIVLALTSWCSPAGAQTKSVAFVGGTLIDGAGRAPVTDSVVIVRDGKFQAIGKRGEVQIPQDAEIIEAAGKSILPGFIDGHCHYRDWMGEIYLAYGVVTCPNISNNPVEWIIAQREGVKNASIRGPRVWASANINYYTGGRTSVGGLFKQDFQANSRAGATLSRRHGMAIGEDRRRC